MGFFAGKTTTRWSRIHDFVRGFGYSLDDRVMYLNDLSLLLKLDLYNRAVTDEQLDRLYEILQPLIEERRQQQAAKLPSVAEFTRFTIPLVRKKYPDLRGIFAPPDAPNAP